MNEFLPPEPPPAPAVPPRRDSAAGSWILIFLVVAAIVFTTLAVKETPEEDEATRLAMIALQAKMLTGFDFFGQWLESSGQGGTAQAEELERSIGQGLDELETFVGGSASARAVAALHAFVGGEQGLQRARELLEEYPPGEDDGNDARLHRLARLALDDPEALEEADRELLRAEMGWFGRLLLAHSLPPDDPARRGLIGSAVRPVLATLGLFLLGILGLLAGLILLIVALVLLGSGKLQFRMTPGPAGGAIYVQAFAAYLSLWFLLQVGPAVLGIGSASIGLAGLVLASAIGVVWPVIRGVPGPTAARDLGFHRGEGWAREIGAGVVGYLAMLPIVAVGFLLTLALVVITQLLGLGADEGSTFIGHPIVVWMSEGNAVARFGLLFLAAVFAPFFEEIMFRGALLRGLRNRFGPIFSGLAVAFIFAVIHPQGILGVPALMSLAFGFALLREWRDSLIAPMVGHAINNGVIVGFMWLAFS